MMKKRLSCFRKMRCLAADRIDIQFTCKEVCRRMSAPCESDWKMLKSIARYLRSHPRVLLQYKYQDPPHSMEAIVDTDIAGCRRTRKSTNGVCVMHGMHLIKSSATMQTVISMSSGEAEHYGVVKGAPPCVEHGRHALAPRLHGQIQTLMPDDCTNAHRPRVV